MSSLWSVRKNCHLITFSIPKIIFHYFSQGIIIIFTYLFDDVQPISKLQPVGSILQFPFFFGTTLFALVGMSVIITLENNMKTPKSFGSPFGVVNWAMALSTALYIVFAFFGYRRYGDAIRDSITLNLPEDTYDCKFSCHIFILIIFFSSIISGSKVIQALFAFSVFLSIGLQMFVAFEIIWRCVSIYFKNQFWGEIIVRLLLAIFICKLKC